MLKTLFAKLSVLFLACCLLSACASQATRLTQGKQSFIQEDYHQAFKTLQPLAVQGVADAQYAVGYMYFYGYGTAQNTQLALKWMQSAAAQGQPAAHQALQMIEAAEVTTPTTVNPTFTNMPPSYADDVPVTNNNLPNAQ